MSTPHKTQDNIQKSTGKSVSCGHQPTPLGWWNVKRLCVYIGLYSSNKAPKINTCQTFWLEGKKFWFVFNSTSLFFQWKAQEQYTCIHVVVSLYCLIVVFRPLSQFMVCVCVCVWFFFVGIFLSARFFCSFLFFSVCLKSYFESKVFCHVWCGEHKAIGSIKGCNIIQVFI